MFLDCNYSSPVVEVLRKSMWGDSFYADFHKKISSLKDGVLETSAAALMNRYFQEHPLMIASDFFLFLDG